MTATQILRILWARRWLFLLIFALAGGAGMTYVLLQPKQYVAQVSLLVDVKPDPILGVMMPGMAQPAFMPTQVEMIRSERVAGFLIERGPNTTRIPADALALLQRAGLEPALAKASPESLMQRKRLVLLSSFPFL